MEPDDPFTVALRALELSDRCKNLPLQPEAGSNFDRECLEAFLTLDRSGHNVCFDWSLAECRRIPNTETHLCTAFVPESHGYRSFDDCAPILLNVTRDRHSSLMTCLTGRGQTSKRGTTGAQSLSRGNSNFDVSQIKRFGISSISELYGEGQSSRFDVTQIKRLGISPSDLGGQTHGSGQGVGGSKIPMASHENTGKARIQCPLCTRTYSCERTLSGHLPSHEGKTYCEICKTVFTTKATFNTHMREKHNIGIISIPKPRSYACTKCSKTFTSKSSLSNHKPYHTGATVCPHCNYRFTDRSGLRKHIAEQHKGNQPAPPK